ncbi:AAA family ATPase [Microbacterium indicum]|uniref:AAA family ATPase n=1 Tax=Microbacterium indicum TaxID=358100 RepID=UPI000420D0EB|nr:MoxR family ATPase [Microbacterium indicum]
MTDTISSAPQGLTADQFRETTGAIAASMRQVIDGKDHAIDGALVVLLAEGNLLVEDVPGVGKTMLARALAASIDADVRRIQFTPDLLPSDVTGVSIFSPATREFEFTPGAVFANIVIADEINRSSPKTQSSLLEAMEERQVSVDGRTYQLPDPFLVVATQNPLEMDGTYALPEAQLDRFMMRMSMGYPDPEAEMLMLRQRDAENPLTKIRPVVDVAGVARLIAFARRVHVSPLIEQYAVSIAQATRAHGELRLGASPRATLQLVRAAKAWAALQGREYVVPDDVSGLVKPIFGHRLVPARTAVGTRRSADPVARILDEIVSEAPVPVADR